MWDKPQYQGMTRRTADLTERARLRTNTAALPGDIRRINLQAGHVDHPSSVAPELTRLAFDAPQPSTWFPARECPRAISPEEEVPTGIEAPTTAHFHASSVKRPLSPPATSDLGRGARSWAEAWRFTGPHAYGHLPKHSAPAAQTTSSLVQHWNDKR